MLNQNEFTKLCNDYAMTYDYNTHFTMVGDQIMKNPNNHKQKQLIPNDYGKYNMICIFERKNINSISDDDINRFKSNDYNKIEFMMEGKSTNEIIGTYLLRIKTT